MPGAEHQPVVGERAAVGERHRARGGVDAGRVGLRERDAVAGDLAVAELLLLDVAQAGDDVVAERAGGEGRVRLDQRHVEPFVERFATRAAVRRQSRRRPRRSAAPRLARASAAAASPGDAGADASGEITAARMKSCHVRLRLFLRAVPGGDRLDLLGGEAFGDAVHDRGRALAAAKLLQRRDDLCGIAADEARRRRRSVAVGEWQPEHDVAPGGASAASAAARRIATPASSDPDNARRSFMSSDPGNWRPGNGSGNERRPCGRRSRFRLFKPHTISSPWFLSGKVR